MEKGKIFTSEAVSEGHPDKVCDQISDAILDSLMKQDKLTRAGIEVMGGKGKVFITGEVTTNALIDVISVTKRVLSDVGYDNNIEVIDNLGKQSPDIALGTNEEVLGAGDNGMMFGYACRETDKYLPKAMVILQELSEAYDKLRLSDTRYLADGKAQITGYYQDNKLVKIKTFTICYQNTEKNRKSTDRKIIEIANEICNKYDVLVEEYLINPTGKFLIGGFLGDAGLTGRKIVVDSYQSFAKVGGGAFSGKDPTKVDRSGAYTAREIAKYFLINNREYEWCSVQLSYAIGIEEPLAIYIETDKGDVEVNPRLYEECRLRNIISDLDLRNICYEERARFGHFR